MKEPLKILFVEDVYTDAELIWHELSKNNIVFEKKLVDNREDYLSALESFKPDLIISDYSLPQFDDLIEMEASEKALRESEERFRMLFDKAPIGYQSLDVNGNFIEVNETWLEMLGYAREDVLGKWFGSFLAPDSIESFRERFSLFKEWGKERSEFEMIKKDGSIRTVVFDGSVGHTPDGEFKQTHCVLEDVTELRRAEETLRESEERFHLAVANSPVPIMIHDEDDNVLLLSKGWTDYSGYTLEDIPTMGDWTEAAYGERSGSSKEYINNLFDILKTQDNGEWTVKAKDGSTRIWEFHTTPLGRVNRSKRVLHSLAFDITERKESEMVLKQKINELEQFNDLTVDRELRMIELKKEVNMLLRQAGREEKYKIID